MFAGGLEQLHCYLWGLVFRNKPVTCKRGSCFANAFGFYSKERIGFGWVFFSFVYFFSFTVNGAVHPFLAVCLIGGAEERNIPENSACTNSIWVKLVPSKCHKYLRLFYFSETFSGCWKMPWSKFFLGRLGDQLNMPTEIGQVHIITSLFSESALVWCLLKPGAKVI